MKYIRTYNNRNKRVWIYILFMFVVPIKTMNIPLTDNKHDSAYLMKIQTDIIFLIVSFIGGPILPDPNYPDYFILKNNNTEEKSIAAWMCVNTFYNKIFSKKYLTLHKGLQIPVLDYIKIDHFFTYTNRRYFLPIYMFYNSPNEDYALKNTLVKVKVQLPELLCEIKVLFDICIKKGWSLNCTFQYHKGEKSNDAFVKRILHMLQVGNDTENFSFIDDKILEHLVYCLKTARSGCDFLNSFFLSTFYKYGVCRQLAKVIKNSKKGICLRDMLAINDIQNSINDNVFDVCEDKAIGKLTKENIVSYLNKSLSDSLRIKKEDDENSLQIKQSSEYQIILNVLIYNIYYHWKMIGIESLYCTNKVKKLCEKYIFNCIDQVIYNNNTLYEDIIITGGKNYNHRFSNVIVPFLKQVRTYDINIPLEGNLFEEIVNIKEESNKPKINYNNIIKQMKKYEFIYKWGILCIKGLFFSGIFYCIVSFLKKLNAIKVVLYEIL